MCPQIDAPHPWPDTLIGSFEDRLSVNSYLYNVADDDAALVHLVVPTYTEVVPIDGGPGDEASADPGPFDHSVFPPGRLPLPGGVNVQPDRSCDAANRKL